jgi:hypothetical protein
MKVVHPDVGIRPNDEMAKRLNEARQVALSGVAEPASELVLRSEAAQLDFPGHTPTTAPERPSERAMRSVVLHHVGQLAYRKRQSVVLAGAMAVVAACLGLISALGKFEFDSTALTYRYWSIVLGILAAAIALVAARIAGLQRKLEVELDEVGETLSDRAAISDAFSEIGVSGFFTRADLHTELEKWRPVTSAERRPTSFLLGALRSLGVLHGPTYTSVPLAHTAEKIGPVDFGKLLLTKALELNMVEEAQDYSSGELVYGYRRV